MKFMCLYYLLLLNVIHVIYIMHETLNKTFCAMDEDETSRKREKKLKKNKMRQLKVM